MGTVRVAHTHEARSPSFDKILSMALASRGSSLSASITSLSSYFAAERVRHVVPDGIDAERQLVNVGVVPPFQGFFPEFPGRCAPSLRLSRWRAVINGHANPSQMGCVVQFVFGIVLINILAITNALIAMFVGLADIFQGCRSFS